MDATAQDRTCPNVPATAPQAVLIGIIGRDGLIKPVLPALPVTPALADAAARRDGGTGLRFAARCVQEGCTRWSADTGRCRVADALLVDHPAEQDGPARLAPCAIRGTCRWFAQNGRAACERCPVVRGTTPTLAGPELSGSPSGSAR